MATEQPRDPETGRYTTMNQLIRQAAGFTVEAEPSENEPTGDQAEPQQSFDGGAAGFTGAGVAPAAPDDMNARLRSALGARWWGTE